MTLCDMPNILKCIVLDRCYDDQNNVYIIPTHLKRNAEYKNINVVDNICKLYLLLHEMNVVSTSKDEIVHHIKQNYTALKSLSQNSMLSDVLKKQVYDVYISELENLLQTKNSHFNFLNRNERLEVNAGLKDVMTRYDTESKHNDTWLLNKIKETLHIDNASSWEIKDRKVEDLNQNDNDKAFYEMVENEIIQKMNKLNTYLVTILDQHSAILLEQVKRKFHINKGEYDDLKNINNNINKIIVNYTSSMRRFTTKKRTVKRRERENQAFFRDEVDLNDYLKSGIHFSEESKHTGNVDEIKHVESASKLIRWNEQKNCLLFSGFIRILVGPKKGQYKKTVKNLVFPCRYYVTDAGDIEETTIDYTADRKNTWVTKTLMLLDMLKTEIKTRKENIINNSLHIIDKKLCSYFPKDMSPENRHLVYRNYFAYLPQQDTYNWDILRKIACEFDEDNNNLLNKFLFSEFDYLITDENGLVIKKTRCIIIQNSKNTIFAIWKEIVEW